jgi:YidC/Oxa1 family membrane protein insertase
MERRVLLAVILSMAVLYAYQAFFAPPPPDQSKPAQSPAATTAPATPPQPGVVTPPVVAAVTTPAPRVLVADAAEREIVVNTADVEAVLTNRGGRLLHWRLKQYFDDNGQPVDLVPSGVPANQPTPFALQFADEQLTSRVNGAVFKTTGDEGGRVDATSAAKSLVFEYADAAGVQVRKELRFEPRDFLLTFSVSATNQGRDLKPAIAWGPGLGDAGATAAKSGISSFFSGNVVQPPRAIFHQDGKVVRLTVAKVTSEPAHESDFRFAGVDDHYFLAAVVGSGKTRVDYGSLTVPAADDMQRQFLTATFRFAQPTGVKFYIGPKQFETLKRVDAELVRAVDFGIFGFIAVPLLEILKWLNGYIGNYGWSIVALTVLVNLVMFPLRHKSVVSMRKMQAIQPQVKAIQDRYADLKMTDPDKQKMNTEVMNLYREKGVNPASGCVPMLLTFPLLYAMYAVLGQGIELRGADFVLWIHDLSQHDPYYVTPLLMGVTLFWQTRMTPTTGDAAQQKMMMYMMPVMMTSIFLRLASGLAIYYLIGNLWAVGQQYFTNRLIGMPAPAVARPPATRKIKTAGASKTPGAK